MVCWLSNDLALFSFSNHRPFHYVSFFYENLNYLLKFFRRFFLCQRIFLVLLLILLDLISYQSQALTSVTSNFIHGNPPYLTFDGGRTRAIDIESLLWITLSNRISYTPATNNSFDTPIELANTGESFADISMLVPIGSNSIMLNSIIGSPNNYWGDDDGDGQGENGISVSGYISLSIMDKNNLSVARSEVPTICKAPYKVILSSTDGTLYTRYGVPNNSNFNSSTVTYYINPKATIPKVCFIKPGSSEVIVGEAGPVSIWNPSEKSFIPQSSYNLNFPTTGANNLYFDLDIGGTNRPLRWDTIELSGIKAIMQPDPTGKSVKVTLTGPVASQEQLEANHLTLDRMKILTPQLPQTFELIGKDNNGNAVIKYGFQLKQWFVNRGSVYGTSTMQTSWCSDIGYRLSSVKDLTNAVYNVNPTIVGATPSSPNNYYMRMIGAGFFTEWGIMYLYSGANFDKDWDHWTSDGDARYGKQYGVGQHTGNIYFSPVTLMRSAVCVTP